MWGYLIGSGKDLSRIETQQGGGAEQEMPWVLGKPFSCIIKKNCFLLCQVIKLLEKELDSYKAKETEPTPDVVS